MIFMNKKINSHTSITKSIKHGERRSNRTHQKLTHRELQLRQTHKFQELNQPEIIKRKPLKQTPNWSPTTKTWFLNYQNMMLKTKQKPKRKINFSSLSFLLFFFLFFIWRSYWYFSGQICVYLDKASRGERARRGPHLREVDWALSADYFQGKERK